jgi:hypothetical protein
MRAGLEDALGLFHHLVGNAAAILLDRQQLVQLGHVLVLPKGGDS